MAAPGMSIEATVDLAGHGGQVKADGDRYRRDLPSTEAEQLLAMVDPARFFQLKADLRSQTSAPYDQYQYDITMETPDGKHHTVTLSGNQTAADLNTLAPGLGNLLEWIRHESDEIWQRRIQRR